MEGLLSSAAALTKAAAKSPQTEVDILMAGLCSHSREVDPFHELQDLLFNLKTIKDLEKYVLLPLFQLRTLPFCLRSLKSGLITF